MAQPDDNPMPLSRSSDYNPTPYLPTSLSPPHAPEHSGAREPYLLYHRHTLHGNATQGEHAPVNDTALRSSSTENRER